MKICNKKTTFKVGNLYMNKESKEVFLACDNRTLYRLEDGLPWNTYGEFGASSTSDWEDVTDKYCLQEI